MDIDGMAIPTELGSLPLGIVFVNEEGVIVSASSGSTSIFGYTQKRLEGMRVEELLSVDSADWNVAPRQSDSREPASRSMGAGRRLRGLRKDGNADPLSIEIECFRTEAGDFQALIIREDFAQKRLEKERARIVERRIRAEKIQSLTAMAQGVAHNLNNGLTVILAALESALDVLPKGSPARQFVEDGRQSAGRAAELGHGLLAYLGQSRGTTEEVNLSEVIASNREELNKLVPNGSVLELKSDSTIPDVSAKPRQLLDAVCRLLENAYESSGGSPVRAEVEVGIVSSVELEGLEFELVVPSGRFAFIRVTDDGMGVEPSVRTRVFEPLFTTKFAGRGMGLSIVRGIVTSHEANISLDSEMGRGTSVTLLFQNDPLADS